MSLHDYFADRLAAEPPPNPADFEAVDDDLVAVANRAFEEQAAFHRWLNGETR